MACVLEQGGSVMCEIESRIIKFILSCLCRAFFEGKNLLSGGEL